MVEELVLVSFFTLFQKIILILVNTIEDLEDIFLAELIEVNPLRGSSCPLLWTVLSLKKVLVALKKVQIWANWSEFRCCQILNHNRLLDRVIFGLLGSRKLILCVLILYMLRNSLYHSRQHFWR